MYQIEFLDDNAVTYTDKTEYIGKIVDFYVGKNRTIGTIRKFTANDVRDYNVAIPNATTIQYICDQWENKLQLNNG